MTPFEWLVSEIERMPGCSATKRAMLALLRRAAGQRLYVARRVIVAPHRLSTARALLGAGLTPTETRARLAAVFECSADTAERIVTQAVAPLPAAATPAQAGLFDDPAVHG